MTTAEPFLIAADHPSSDGRLTAFLGGLRAEHRFFGPSARHNPKPFPSLVTALEQRRGLRLGHLEGDRIVGVVRVTDDGEVFLAVAADRRGDGIGRMLLAAALHRAGELGHRRLMMRSSRRSTAARRIAEQLGCTVVHHARGRTDLILPVANRRADDIA